MTHEIKDSSWALLANYANYCTNCIDAGVMPTNFNDWCNYIALIQP